MRLLFGISLVLISFLWNYFWIKLVFYFVHVSFVYGNVWPLFSSACFSVDFLRNTLSILFAFISHRTFFNFFLDVLNSFLKVLQSFDGWLPKKLAFVLKWKIKQLLFFYIIFSFLSGWFFHWHVFQRFHLVFAFLSLVVRAFKAIHNCRHSLFFLFLSSQLPSLALSVLIQPTWLSSHINQFHLFWCPSPFSIGYLRNTISGPFPILQ